MRSGAFVHPRHEVPSHPMKIFDNFTTKDWALWIASLLIVTVSNGLSQDFDVMILAASLIGVSCLLFSAKGNIWAPVTGIAFSILYAMISYRFQYWGEMITYLGMNLPMCLWSTVEWLRNPSEHNANEVAISKMTKRKWVVLGAAAVVVTVIFFYILRAFDTPNLAVSTISITTSFMAASLMMMRMSVYGLFYAANDMVLITLWVLASLVNPVYLPVAVTCMTFLVNDVYAYFSWTKREKSLTSMQ